MTRSVRRRARAGLLTPLLLVSSALATAGLGGGAAAQAGPDVGSAAQDQPLVAPEDCRTVFPDDVTARRYAGDNRYETAVCASYWTWTADNDPSGDRYAQAVVLARGDDFADALAGGPLAGYVEGPLLLTRPTELPAIVLQEIQRVLPPGGPVYLLGSTAAISTEVENELRSAGIPTRRLAGDNRYETAIAIAEELPDNSNFFFATGLNFPDALGAATAGAHLSRMAKLVGGPENPPHAVLLTADEAMPTVVSDFVEERANQIDSPSLFTVGAAADQAAVSAFGEERLAARYVGANRYETAVKVAEGVYLDEEGELIDGRVGLATGTDFPDALAASANLVFYAQPLLLTNPTQLATPTRIFLEDHAGEGWLLDVFGGRPAVRGTVVAAAVDAFTAD